MAYQYSNNNNIHLKDAQHAQNFYTQSSLRFAPNVKYLYHVVFNLKKAVGVGATPNDEVARFAPNTSRLLKEIAVMVKTADLPQYTASVDTKNQYNRKKNIQTRIDYSPVTITLHDDNSSVTSTMMKEYYNYYYTDGVNSPTAYSTRNKYNSNNRFRYGLDNDKTDTFFDNIKIFQLSRQRWYSYTLVNPLVTSWGHDSLDYSDGAGTLENTMTINYESVFYDNGKVGENSEPINFEDPSFYDTTPSPLEATGSSGWVNPDISNVIPSPVSGLVNTLNTITNIANTASTVANVFNQFEGLSRGAQIGSAAILASRLIPQQPNVLSGAQIASEINASPQFGAVLTKQAVLKGYVPGFDSTNAWQYDELSTTEKNDIMNDVLAKSTQVEETAESLPIKRLATNIIQGG